MLVHVLMVVTVCVCYRGRVCLQLPTTTTNNSLTLSDSCHTPVVVEPDSYTHEHTNLIQIKYLLVVCEKLKSICTYALVFRVLWVPSKLEQLEFSWQSPHRYYIIITIVQSYTGKYHEFVAVCIVTSAQHE